MKTKNKLVTNVLEHISKLRDILESKDLENIHKHLYLFRLVQNEISRQCNKYISYPTHELDFTYTDLQELSDATFEIIKNFQQKFLFTRYHKEIMQNTPIDNQKFKDFSENIGFLMRIDTDLREFYKTVGYYAITVFLWSNTDDKKDFSTIITDTIRSFL